MDRREALRKIVGGTGAFAGVTLHAQTRSLDDWRRVLAAPTATADAASADERLRLLAAGEALLASGDGVGAQEQFQRAALMAHAADTECGIVRAHMQCGEYRRALAFGSHAALAHRDFPAGSALYAWLLHLGGQGGAAQRHLDDALQRHGSDAALQSVREALAQPHPVAQSALLSPPGRLAPYAHGAAGAADPRALGGAVLGERSLAWAPRAALRSVAPGAPLWVRNGLGLTVAVDADPLAAPEHDLVRLRLRTPMAWPDGLAVAPSRPFAGAPASLVAFAPQAAPAWPLLRQLFLGRSLADGTQALALQPGPSAPGGVVFDRNGQLAGLALAHADGSDRIVPCTQWPGGVRSGDGARLVSGADDIYERALHIGLQLLTGAA
jgi:hypothetical protein